MLAALPTPQRQLTGPCPGSRDEKALAGDGEGIFHLPVRPGIAMSLGRKIMSGEPSIIFKSHLHGPKRSRKKAFPPPPALAPGLRRTHSRPDRKVAGGAEGIKGLKRIKGLMELRKNMKK